MLFFISLTDLYNFDKMAKEKLSKATQKKKDELTSDKEPKVDFLEVMKDERTHKITGAFILFFAFVLFISFISYLGTWEDDQDKVLNTGMKLFWGTDSHVSNLLGTLGAFLSHFFIYRGFGLASFFIPFFFFVAGFNWFIGKAYFSVLRHLKYMLVGLVFFSVSFALVFDGWSFPYGGAVGKLCMDSLTKTIGSVGSYALMVVGLLSYVIWRFNPSFLFTFGKVAEAVKEDLDQLQVADTLEPAVVPEEKKEGNFLKEKVPVVEDDPTQEFELTEKNEEPLVEELPVMPLVEETPKPSKATANPKLELEIKTVPDPVEAEPIVEAPKVGSLNTLYDPVLDLKDYKYPHLDLLETHGSEKIVQDANELETNKVQIINTLKNYDIDIQKISATVGPTVTLYEIIPAAGIRISRIKNLEDDIALSLAALGIRIIAPIPGKGTIGIEVPNAKKTIVSMRTLLASEKFQNNKFSLPIALGKKIDNENFIVDLANMPHLLMAGATGQGKSVGLNAILVSLLYKKHPSQLKFVLVDPKKVELSIYKTIEKHFLAKLPGEEDAIITDTKKVVHTLNALCIEMDNRYDLLKEAGVRNIREYNEKFASRKLNPEKGHQFLPFIVLVVDEFADLIMTAGKEVEMPIARLAQLARAVGVHLIIATQRPSVNIITGTIKANFPARIAFKVSSKIDSRTILDVGGAEQLIGKGDMLVSYNGELVRLQCAFVDTPEVDKVNEFIGEQRGYPQAFMLPEYIDEKEMEKGDFDVNDKDPLFEDAARLIVSSQSGSTSLLQRRMKLGYNRAGRLMDQLEAAGIVGPNQGSKVRDVLYKTEAELQQYLDSLK